MILNKKLFRTNLETPTEDGPYLTITEEQRYMIVNCIGGLWEYDHVAYWLDMSNLVTLPEADLLADHRAREFYAWVCNEVKAGRTAGKLYADFKARDRGINGESVLQVGKHAGRKLKDVPARYLLYLYDNHYAYPELREYIKKNLEEIKKNRFKK